MKSGIIKHPPFTQRGADRCALLFEIATELFIKHGYDHVTLDQIVEHAGGSKATIYKYFGNKKGLFLAICQERSNKFIHQIAIACQQHQLDIKENLSNLLFDLYKIFTDEKSCAFGRLIVQISLVNPELSQELYDLGHKRAHDLLADFLQRAHNSGQIYCTRPEDSAIYFFGFFHDLHWRTLVGLPNADLDHSIKDHISYIVDLFIAGHQRHT